LRLRTRLFLGFFLLTGAGFYVLVGWILRDLRPRYLESSEEGLIDSANLLAALIEEDIGPDGAIPVDRLRGAYARLPGRPLSALIYRFAKTRVDLRVYVTDSLGKVLFDSDAGRDEGKDYSQWRDVFLTLRGRYGARTTRVNPSAASSSVLYVAAPLRVSGGRIAGVVTVSKPSNSINLFLQAARGKIVFAGLLAAVAVALAGMVLSAFVTRPIQRITEYARAVRDGRPAAFPALGRSEIGEMGRAFEEMREALEGRKYVEQYVHTLTHELKSPISSVRGAAELLQEEMPPERRAGFLANIRSETERMQTLVDRMLDLSGLESRRGLLETEPVEVASLAAETHARLESALARKGLRWVCDIAPGLTVPGERFLLQQAMLNLAENAVSFSPRNGTIAVRASRGLEGRRAWARIEILDEGPGLPDFAGARVFEKFYSLQRPDTGRKSSGLGLTIVQEITRLHAGTIRLENRSEGGLRAEWNLPAEFTASS
jgi:two-component system sensor histidine kinase CreC